MNHTLFSFIQDSIGGSNFKSFDFSLTLESFSAPLVAGREIVWEICLIPNFALPGGELQVKSIIRRALEYGSGKYEKLIYSGVIGVNYAQWFYLMIFQHNRGEKVKWNLTPNLKFENNSYEKMNWQDMTQEALDFMDKEDENWQNHLMTHKKEELLCVDVGAGYSRRPGLIPIDIMNTGHDALVCDFEKDPLPFEDSTVDRIYAVHLLEHLTASGLNHFLEEAYRVLKPGCSINAIVPHASSEFAQHPYHYLQWNEWFIKEICGKVRIYTPVKEQFWFGCDRHYIWGKRSDQIHFSFLLDKTIPEMQEYYTKRGNPYVNNIFEKNLQDFYQKQVMMAVNRIGKEQYGY